MHSLILHIISKSHPSWQLMHSLIFHVNIKIPPPLASTCTFSSYTSYQIHPLWQVHAQSHLTHHIKIPPPLATTCTVSSSTSYQNPTPSGKYMHSLILHVISKSHPLWQVHAQSHLTRHIKIPDPCGKYMHSLTLHVISKSHPLWQVHAQSHLTRHIKIPPPLASTCTVSSYTSYQNPTPSGNYMHSLIFHVISKSHPLWQVHAQSHLTRNLKIPPPLASTCTVSSYTSYQNPTPCGKYMHSLTLHVISESHPPLAITSTATFYTSYQNPTPSGKYMHILIFHVISKSPPPLASTCTVSSYTSSKEV